MVERFLLARSWKRRESLVDIWALIDPDQQGDALVFWIRSAETDEWTREQLRSLFAHCADAGAIPLALQGWVNEDYLRRLPPLRSGPRTDHASDYRIMAAVEIRKLLHGETNHAARHAVAKDLNRKNRQFDKVRGAHERGSRWPPGVWANPQVK